MEMDERVAVAHAWQQVELGRRAGGGVEPGWAGSEEIKKEVLSQRFDLICSGLDC